MAHVYTGRIGQPGAWRDFMWRRFSRIYPLHLLVLLGMLVLATASRDSKLLSVAGARYYFASVLLIHNWGFFHELSWNVPSWSISTELAAYIMFAAVYRRIPWGRLNAGKLLVAIGALTLILYGLYAYLRMPFPGTIARTGLQRCLIEFAIGTITWHLTVRLGQHSYAAVIGGTMAACLTVVQVAVPSLFAIPLIAASLVFTAACWKRGNPLAWRPLVQLGHWSYATYLTHYSLWKLFKLGFIRNGAGLQSWHLVLFLAVLVALSYMLYTNFELPAQTLLRKRKPIAMPIAAHPES